MNNDNFLKEVEALYNKFMKVVEGIIDVTKTLEEQDDKTKLILVNMYQLYNFSFGVICDKHNTIEDLEFSNQKIQELREFIESEES